MVHDSVREELQTKIGTVTVQRNVEKAVEITAESIEAPAAPMPATPNPRPVRTTTTELNRQKTSKTLVEFQTKNPAVPDWRLQLQNAVRSRRANGSTGTAGNSYQAQLVTSGANALKAEYVEEAKEAPPTEHKDKRIENALRRIDNSRKTFLPEPAPTATASARSAVPRNYPFNVVSRVAEQPVKTSEIKAMVNVAPKPHLVPTITLKKTGYDTNKLPPIAEEQPVSSLDMPVAFVIEEPAIPKPVSRKVQVEAEPEIPAAVEETLGNEIESLESNEIDDLAPFATRFNAGLFDLIIGLFASLILLSPVAFAGGEWFSGSGLLALAGTCSVVMFVYLTSAVALFGRTAGMKLFSLELVDADMNEYPTFHQAAVSSAVYLLTLPIGGIGFLTMLFNDEKRAAHDLLSGTIIVSEF